MNKRDFNVVGNEGTDNQELAKGIAFVKSRRAELNVVQMVESMRDQAMPNGVNKMDNRTKKTNNKRFVRYPEGAEMYSMSLSKFQQLAKDAKACYKMNRLVLVNLDILDEYLETFHIEDEEFYK